MDGKKWTFTSHDVVTVRIRIDPEENYYYGSVTKTLNKEQVFFTSSESANAATLEGFVIKNLYRLLVDGLLSEDGREFLSRSLAEEVGPYVGR